MHSFQSSVIMRLPDPGCYASNYNVHSASPSTDQLELGPSDCLHRKTENGHANPANLEIMESGVGTLTIVARSEVSKRCEQAYLQQTLERLIQIDVACSISTRSSGASEVLEII